MITMDGDLIREAANKIFRMEGGCIVALVDIMDSTAILNSGMPYRAMTMTHGKADGSASNCFEPSKYASLSC